MGDDVELLPCPFCGVAAAEVGGLVPWVQCPSCDATGPQRESDADAVAAWNRRAAAELRPIPEAPDHDVKGVHFDGYSLQTLETYATAYARANVLHHTAPLKYALDNAARGIKTLREVRDRQAAEIEALRAEVDRLAAKWRGQANSALRRSGTWSGDQVADRIEYYAGELDALLREQEEGK